MVKSSSVPLLQQTANTSASDPVTPRRQRGLVRRVSKVQIEYPKDELMSSLGRKLLKSRSLSNVGRPSSAASDTGARAESSVKLKKSKSNKRVSFADTGQDDSESAPSKALELSRRRQSAMHDLRRVTLPDAKDGDAAAAEAQGADNNDEAESMLRKILSSLHDTEASLQETQKQLMEGNALVAECGGSRHATSVISGRILSCLERRAALLRTTEAQIASSEAVHAQCDEILAALVQDPVGYALPTDMINLKKFINAYTHSPGNPADSNKGNFVSFVATMKLPSKHYTLEHLRQHMNVAGEWWADACLEQASEGAGFVTLKRLFDVAVHIGVDSDHPKLCRAMQILRDRLAEHVLEEANEIERIDAEEEKSGKVPVVGMATKKAEKIEAIIAKAIKDGVAKNDSRLSKAWEIVKTLRERDGLRKRMAGRQKRLEGK